MFWKASICIADTNCWGPNYNRSPSEIFWTQPNPPLKHVVNFSIIYDHYYSYISYMTIIHIFNILPLGNLETSLASTPRKKSQLWKRRTWGTIVKGNVSRARLFWPQSRTAPSASARGLCVILWSIPNLKLQIFAIALKMFAIKFQSIALCL